MAITYLEISYPNFVLGAIIDPEEANQNNHDLQTKINSIIVSHNVNLTDIVFLKTSKADITYVNSQVSNLAGVGRTTETVKLNATNMITHKSSTDHDYRYYIKSEIDSKLSVINTSIANHKSSADHDVRYYTREELTPWLRGGDTSIREEVFTIISSNNGDGTFTYSRTGSGQTIISPITSEGYQVFNLDNGFYAIGTNRIELIVNDTLRRSVASGGIVELSGTSVALTSPEGNGAEITIRYYERIGMTAEYNIKLSKDRPPNNDGKNMWFKILN